MMEKVQMWEEGRGVGGKEGESEKLNGFIWNQVRRFRVRMCGECTCREGDRMRCVHVGGKIGEGRERERMRGKRGKHYMEENKLKINITSHIHILLWGALVLSFFSSVELFCLPTFFSLQYC